MAGMADGIAPQALSAAAAATLAKEMQAQRSVESGFMAVLVGWLGWTAA
jgi:hypothetical protein